MATQFQDRAILLLQGPRSAFFGCLADALTARGARVERVLFCPGDELFWLGRKARRWRRGQAGWAEAARRLMRELAITDVVALGDGRALHAAAFAQARALGLRNHVVEQGWLRPGWLTVEPEALGAWRPSRADLAQADAPCPPQPRFPASFAHFAAMDVGYRLANLALGRALYPGYRAHDLASPAAEWGGWAMKAARAPLRLAQRRRALARIAQARGPVFLFALQLETDFQIRQRGPEGGLRAALARVLADFAAHAPEGALLAVKPHPLDPQIAPWRRILRDSPAAARAIFLDGGSLEALFGRLAGVVVVNSTVGLSALRAAVPVHTLGAANYAAPGLADARPLREFWANPCAPDPARVAAFTAALAAQIQVPGGFDGAGMRPGAEAVAQKILEAAP